MYTNLEKVILQELDRLGITDKEPESYEGVEELILQELEVSARTDVSGRPFE